MNKQLVSELGLSYLKIATEKRDEVSVNAIHFFITEMWKQKRVDLDAPAEEL